MNQELINESVKKYLEVDKIFKGILGEYFPTTWGEVNVPKKVLNHEGLERIKKAEERSYRSKKDVVAINGLARRLFESS